MSRSITVNPDKLNQAAGKIEQEAADYKQLYDRLFNEVDGMGAAWQGQDNMAFVTQIKGFMEDFNKMESLMRQYSEFLRLSAKTYQETQNEVIHAAKRLTN
ncbi:WXG100 family type VII secretion target [Radiobacillus kanasensis]|uniref:WXG100 family type VII secretion target n=1 Tax=Radiobacillus kanasensis TaxID=2844358 RepID=UPI001E3BD4DC|nr:WXG100 family type VII secretion target [Radiobacillus kanasensis]UFT99203.1 WXG100 family type VII secretion target [Radiobacillus kanasensis]